MESIAVHGDRRMELRYVGNKKGKVLSDGTIIYPSTYVAIEEYVQTEDTYGWREVISISVEEWEAATFDEKANWFNTGRTQATPP